MQEPWELHWRDYYSLLGLRPSAEPEAVEGAAKQLLAKYHPDKSGTGNTELFKQINEAREVLTDPVRRRRYDADYKRRASKQKQSHKSPTPSKVNKPDKKSSAPGLWKGVLIGGGGLLVAWWLSGGENSEVRRTLRERPAERVATVDSPSSYPSIDTAVASTGEGQTLTYDEFVATDAFKQVTDTAERQYILGTLYPTHIKNTRLSAPLPNLVWEELVATQTFRSIPPDEQRALERQHFATYGEFEVRREARKQGVDPDLMVGLIMQESGGDTGPTQLPPAVAAKLGVDRTKPSENIRGRVGYFKRQLVAFSDKNKALAAYYVGPGRVRQALVDRPEDWTGWLDENTAQPFGQPAPSQYIAEVRSHAGQSGIGSASPAMLPETDAVRSAAGLPSNQVDTFTDDQFTPPPDLTTMTPEQFQHYMRALLPPGTDYE